MVLQMSLLKVGLNAQGLYADFNGLHRKDRLLYLFGQLF